MRIPVYALILYGIGLCSVFNACAIYAKSVQTGAIEGTQDRIEQIEDNRWLVQAKMAMAEKDWNEAVHILAEVLEEKPDELRARRLRAISYREKAKIVFYNRVRPLYFLRPRDLRLTRREASQYAMDQTEGLESNTAKDVTRAIFDFEFILYQDSLFLDVLHQYAILWRDHQVLEEAIDLEELQLYHKPDIAEAHVELVSLYRQFINWTKEKKAIDWLQRKNTAYSDYFEAEVMRIVGKLDEAETIFERMLNGPLAIPRQPILLSRARICVTRGQDEEGYRFIEEALKLNDMSGARLLFEDFKYILTPEEYEIYRQLSTVEDFGVFFTKMWERRDPLPAAGINTRLVEHYRRLIRVERDYVFWGERTWFNNPDEGMELDIPTVASLNSGFNDKGLIYIRHGEPDERMVSVRASLPNESWRYREQKMDFHFVVARDAVGHNWRLTPVIDDCYAMVDRSEWGGFYIQMSPPIRLGDPCAADEDLTFRQDYVSGRVSMADDSRENVSKGLTTDRHTWEKDVETFLFPILPTAYRGSDGKTHLQIYYGIPTGELTNLVEDMNTNLEVEVGVAIHDTLWQNLGERKVVKTLQRTSDRSSLAVDFFQVNMVPQSYQLAVHVRSLHENVLGGYKLDYNVPDFSGNALNISDILPAYQVMETDLTGRYTKRGHYIRANPSGQFSKQQTVYVYYELYNLTMDENGRTSYEIEYTLESMEKHGKVLGLAGGEKIVLTVRAEGSGREASPALYSEIDVSSVPAGRYTLRVRVTDIQTGGAVENTREMELL